jgi:hypothetical protein
MVFMASRHGFLPEALVSLSALYRKKHVGCMLVGCLLVGCIRADRAHGLVLACCRLACCRAMFAAISLARAALFAEGAQAPKYPAKPGKSRVRHRVGKSGRRKPKFRSQ